MTVRITKDTGLWKIKRVLKQIPAVIEGRREDYLASRLRSASFVSSYPYPFHCQAHFSLSDLCPFTPFRVMFRLNLWIHSAFRVYYIEFLTKLLFVLFKSVNFQNKLTWKQTSVYILWLSESPTNVSLAARVMNIQWLYYQIYLFYQIFFSSLSPPLFHFDICMCLALGQC